MVATPFTGEVERAQVETWKVEHEFQNSPDGLINLIQKQYPGEGLDTDCWTRIAEIFKRLNEDSVMPIDLNNKLHRECLCAILTVIYAPFEKFLRDTWDVNCPEHELHNYLYYMWWGLHHYLLGNGFDIENVMQFIGMYERTNFVGFIVTTSSLWNIQFIVAGGKQFRSHLTSHRGQHEALTADGSATSSPSTGPVKNKDN